MTIQPTLIAILLLVISQVHADESAEAKTVIGPRNIFLYDGASALRAGDGETGVKLTLQGLRSANGRREEKVAHANLCAGYLLVGQYETALKHCDWVVDKYPNHWRTYNNRAIVYLRLKRFDESDADIRKGQALNPGSEKLKEVKGMYLDEVEPVNEYITIDERRDGGARSDEDGD